ncbi:glycoside hydrolase family 32 protein [Cyclobacterium plantarum]|uniref:Glycoside hydrolase family 32 protein n=1 Tax=Cyclobacterium plantarum TaxID=2716263 RepID=A0ABX0H0J8_9BACT|nr:glycoside hydrolase family 32 protein [Cyclobacterium plantarum]NHE55319.1 glycoside hydrolase family 32 protein [Cyclobacterium plantarum]
MNRYIIWSLLFITTMVASCDSGVPLESEDTNDSRIYNEPHRPQYHFSPEANWMNDPNGMVFHEGEYHLFYQYYPDSNVWGPMHWGHAVSKDLVRWEHLPVAIEPDSLGWIFSGSAVFDAANSSGLGSPENPPLVALYTYHDPVGAEAGKDDYQTQGLAFSLDNGRTWEKYQNNPVLENPGIKDFRDPKVTQIDQGKWIMSLAVKDKISFYASDNLLGWEHLSDFNPDWAAYGGVWECPDLFPLTTPEGEQKWVLLVSINPGGPNGGSATQYFIGDFDGKKFTTEQRAVKWLDYGADNYAGVTWSNVPATDGRKLFIGWMSNWMYANVVPTQVWRSANTLPRSLELYSIDQEYHLASRPVKELEMLREESQVISGQNIILEQELIELQLQSSAADFSIEFSNSAGERVIIEKEGETLFVDRTESGLVDFNEGFPARHGAPVDGLEIEELRIFLDRSSIEIFINNGELVMTDLVFPRERYTRLYLEGFENENQLHYLRSVW